MKKHRIISAVLALSAIIGSANSQTINWGSLREENKHIVNVSLGLEDGIIYGVGYGYHFKAWIFPVVANIEYSFPSGTNIFDDFKTKTGLQIDWVGIHHFHFSTRVQGVFRRYENDLVRLVNFGSDLSGTVGYYRNQWFVAGEMGFDKAIVTNFRHSAVYKDRFPGVVDGWYEPATGGIVYYGLQAGFSYKQHDIYLKAGKTITQDFRTEPMVPYYAQLGYNYRIGSKKK